MNAHNKIKMWGGVAIHYSRLSGTHTSTGSKLACLVLADYCIYEGSGDRGGPTEEMVQLAEGILGASVDEVIQSLVPEAALVHSERAVNP